MHNTGDVIETFGRESLSRMVGHLANGQHSRYRFEQLRNEVEGLLKTEGTRLESDWVSRSSLVSAGFGIGYPSFDLPVEFVVATSRVWNRGRNEPSCGTRNRTYGNQFQFHLSLQAQLLRFCASLS